MFGLVYEERKIENELKEKYEKQINELKEFRGIGEKFTFLGVDIIVTHHSEPRQYNLSVIDEPVLIGKYINKAGEIKSVTFDYDALEAVKAENRN